MSHEFSQSSKNSIKRGGKRASYDREQIFAILDDAYLCHVAFVQQGEARIIPTAYVRIENAIYVHGHLHNQMLHALIDGQTAAISVTLVDGLVLARSAFHHSVNYRSVVLFGKGKKVDGDEKVAALDALVNHMLPGRVERLRPYWDKELDATLVIKFEIEEASAKIRTGPPVDADKDYELPIWAGVLNLKTVVESVTPCPQLLVDVGTPEHVTEFIATTNN